MAEQKDYTGVLFKNDKRTEENKQPHYNGSMTVDGKQYWLSCYVNKSNEGKMFMSLSLKPKDAQAATRQPGHDNQDLPF